MATVEQLPAAEPQVRGGRPLDVGGSLNLAGRFERLPLSGYQRKLFLIIATAWLFDSIDLAALTFVLAPISNEFGLSTSQAGLLASASFAGMFVGASGAGILADRIGRKAVFQTSMVVWGLASLATVFTWDLTSIVICRFLIGVGMGAEFPVAQSLVSEFIPSRERGKYIAWLEGFWPLGFVACGVLSVILLPLFGWRSLFIVQAVLALYVLVIRRQVPESPRWLESHGRLAEADETMARIERDVERADGRPLPEPAPARFRELASRRFSLAELFSPSYRSRTVMTWVLWFCVLLGYYGITTWIAKLLADNGLSVAKSTSFVLLMTLWGIPGFLSAAQLIDRVGRKPVLTGYILLSAAAAVVYGQASSTAELIIAGSFMQFFFFGMWSSLYAYTPEVFPTRARATGCGTASGVGRIGAVIGPYLVPVIVAASGGGMMFTLAAVMFVIAAVVVLVLGPETKQKVLEEVSA
jgi:putative MFS transporter